MARRQRLSSELSSSAALHRTRRAQLRQESAVRLSVEEVPATPAMASTLMVIHILQRSVLRRPETETCAVRSAHASREVLDRSLSCGRSVDAIGAPQRLRCQLPHIGASGAPAASNEACWCATAWRTGQRKPTVRETPFFHTVVETHSPLRQLRGPTSHDAFVLSYGRQRQLEQVTV